MRISPADILLSQVDGEDFPNTLIIGSGKTQLVSEFLSRRYGQSAIDWRPTYIQELDDTITMSPIAYKLDMRIHRKTLLSIIKTLASSLNVASGLYNIFIITHFEELGLIAQGSLRRIIERTRDTARFIVCHSGEPSGIIEPIKSRFQVLYMNRVPSLAHILDLYDSMNIPKYLPPIVLESVYEEFDNYILNQSWTRIVEIRKILLALIERGYNMKNIGRGYIHHLLNDKTAWAMLILNNVIEHIGKFLECMNKYDNMCIEKDIYQLEYVLIEIKRIGRFK